MDRAPLHSGISRHQHYASYNFMTSKIQLRDGETTMNKGKRFEAEGAVTGPDLVLFSVPGAPNRVRFRILGGDFLLQWRRLRVPARSCSPNRGPRRIVTWRLLGNSRTHVMIICQSVCGEFRLESPWQPPPVICFAPRCRVAAASRVFLLPDGRKCILIASSGRGCARRRHDAVTGPRLGLFSVPALASITNSAR